MQDIRKIRCSCCKCYDSFDGCTAFDCSVDFEIHPMKLRETAKEYGMSPGQIVAAIIELQKEEKARETSVSLPSDFDPETDTEFLISFADATDLGKKRLVDMDTEDLEKLRAELEFVLETRKNE